jgi:acid stress chaperone HdeB
MKIGFTLAIAAALAASGPLHAQERIDLASLKCSAYLASSPDNIRLILMWLEGYYSEENASPIVDLEKLKAQVAKFNGHCGKNPNQPLIEAADVLLGK